MEGLEAEKEVAKLTEAVTPPPEPKEEPTPKTKADELFGSELAAELKERYNKSVERDKQIEEAAGNQNVVWKPHAGPQTDFLKSSEYEVLFCGGRGPLVYGTQVITPSGPVAIEDLEIGDLVCLPNGGIAPVIDIPFDGPAPCARLTFSDGRQVTSTIDHRWTGRTPKGKSGYQRKDRVVLTHEFENGGQIPLTSPVYLEPQPILLDPYMLGVMLGDGHINTHISLTSWDRELIDYCLELYPQASEYREGKEIRWVRHSRQELSSIFEYYNLKGCLSPTKFIPREYLYNTVDVRLAVLQGLMDTDGSAGIANAEYTTVSEQLAKDVQQLVWSLGGRATLSTKVGSYSGIECLKVYRLYITLQDTCPFRLARKATKYSQSKTFQRKNYLTVLAYEDVGNQLARCITVNHPDHEILVDDYIVTKNSGKSDCLLMDTCRENFIGNPAFRGLIIRRTMPALREIIRRAKDIYNAIAPGVKWKEQEKMFVFPSGATVEMGYFDHMDDYDRYHGREFNWVGIDEISQYETKEYYDKLKSVARSTAKDIPVRIRATTNPSGPGRGWIKEYFIDAAPSNTPVLTELDTPIGAIKISRKYIKSTIFDNPTILDKDPQYVAYLSTLPEVQRRQWLEGDFDAAEGLAFEEFHKNTHVIKRFDIPHNWVKFRAIDWGFRSKAVCLWFAVDFEGDVYIYREYVSTQVTADKFAQNVLNIEAGEYISYGLIDGSVGIQSGVTGPTVEEEMQREGLSSIHADKSKGSRIHGKNLIHKYLQIDPDTEQPRLKIVENCTQLIKELSSLMVAKNNPEDVDTHMEDHAYDALRYGLMSRPPIQRYSPFDTSFNDLPPVVNSTFGY